MEDAFPFIHPTFLRTPSPKEKMKAQKKVISTAIKRDFFKYAGRNHK